MNKNRETPELHWRLLPGNKFAHKIHAGMLMPEGFYELQKMQPPPYVKGQPQQYFRVHYDRDYFFQKLIKEVIVPMNIPDKERWYWLCDMIWDYHVKTLQVGGNEIE